MSKTRKQYEEFKVMAVELSKSRSDLSVLSKELEIKPSLLYRLRKEMETKAETSFPGQVKVIFTPEQADIHRLKKELLDMQQERDTLQKLLASSPGAMANIPVHKDNRMEFDIGKMCKIFNVSRSGYYKWLDLCSNLSSTGKENQQLTDQDIKVHANSNGTYGSSRIASELMGRAFKYPDRK